MRIIEVEKAARSQLQRTLEQLEPYDVDELVRSNLGPELNFELVRPLFELVIRIRKQLLASLDVVPTNNLKTLGSHFAGVLSIFEQIKEFSLTKHSENPVGARDGLVQQLMEQYTQLYLPATLAVAYHQGDDRLDVEEMKKQLHREFNKKIDQLATEIPDKVAVLNNALEEATNIVKVMRDAAGEIGVGAHAEIFKEEAEAHEKSGQKWFWGSAASGLATAAFAAWQFGTAVSLDNLPGITAGQAIFAGIPRILFLSVLVAAVAWCMRNYGAHRHNFVINRHRRNALATFETFVAGAGGDEDTKNAVLLRSTETIFSPANSGYLKTAKDSAPTAQMLEIVRSSVGKSVPKGE